MQPLTLRWCGYAIPLCLLLLLYNVLPTTAQTYKGFRVGRYEEKVYNKTGNNYGKGLFDMLSIGANGAVRAHLREYDGLEGEGDLSGAINTQGVMQLRGGLTSPSTGAVWQSAVIAVMQNGNFRLGNRITLNGKLEEESVTMTYAVVATPQPAQSGPPARTVGGSGGIPNNVYLRLHNGMEVEAWYFGANGRVWRNLQEGSTQAGLAAHQSRWRGTYRLNGDQLSITADDGTIDRHTYKSERGRPELDDMYLSAVTPATNPQLLVGEYFHNGGNGSISTASTLTLRADGSYTRSGVGSYRADGQSHGGSSEDTGT